MTPFKGMASSPASSVYIPVTVSSRSEMLGTLRSKIGIPFDLNDSAIVESVASPFDSCSNPCINQSVKLVSCTEDQRPFYLHHFAATISRESSSTNDAVRDSQIGSFDRAGMDPTNESFEIWQSFDHFVERSSEVSIRHQILHSVESKTTGESVRSVCPVRSATNRSLIPAASRRGEHNQILKSRFPTREASAYCRSDEESVTCRKE